MSARVSRLLLGACLILPGLAHASRCSVTVVSVAFGNYDIFATSDTSTTGNIQISCANTTSYTISLSPGFGTFTSRVMTNGSNQLDYNLFTDSQHLSVWGDGTSGSVTVSATASSGSYTVYGLIPARQNVPVGSYSDTVTITVTY